MCNFPGMIEFHSPGGKPNPCPFCMLKRLQVKF